MYRNNLRFRTYARLTIAIACSLLIIGSGILLLILHNPSGQTSSTRPGSKTTVTQHATATATNTPTATPTSTTTEDITPAPTPLFSDDFSNNSQDWYVNNSTGYIRSLTADGLVLTDTNHHPMIESLPTNHKFDDFTLTTTLTLKRGDSNDSTGVYLRGDSNLDHDYRIDIFGNNMYAISKEYLDTNNTPQTLFIVAPAHVASLKPRGEPNALTVIMKESTLFLLINGKFVNAIIDEDYTHGQIALFVANGATSSGVTAIFSSIEIISAPSDQFPLLGGCVTATPTVPGTVTITPMLSPCSGTCATSITGLNETTSIACK